VAAGAVHSQKDPQVVPGSMATVTTSVHRCTFDVRDRALLNGGDDARIFLAIGRSPKGRERKMTAMWRRSRLADGGEHELARDATLRVRQGRGELALGVSAGCVMVTREGDPEDYVLGPGDELRLVGRGLTVAWALSPARLVVSRGATATAAGAVRRHGEFATA
jgi:hypothetical protein